MTAIADAWRDYADNQVPEQLSEEMQRRLKRAFYAGAQSTALAVRKGDAKPAEVLQEVAFFGQQIGTAHELRT